MRYVLLAGASVAIGYAVMNRVFALLNRPHGLAVAGGYGLGLILAAALVGLASWLRRRA